MPRMSQARTTNVHSANHICAYAVDTVQADELALVVFYTTGVPKKRAGEGQRTAHGTRWGELLGCGNTALGIRDPIVKSHSPCLRVTDSAWRKI